MSNIFANELSQRRSEAAKRYAAADKSDPFSYNRAMSHHNNGLCGTITVMEHGKSVVKSGHYDSDTFASRHDVDPRWEPLRAKFRPHVMKVDGTRYQNVQRP